MSILSRANFTFFKNKKNIVIKRNKTDRKIIFHGNRRSE